jgi:hypothetical protein
VKRDFTIKAQPTSSVIAVAAEPGSISGALGGGGAFPNATLPSAVNMSKKPLAMPTTRKDRANTLQRCGIPTPFMKENRVTI